jgi:ribosomal protein S18 acetylase RimI-like enzyme
MVRVEIMRGDRLAALTQERPALLQQDIYDLWQNIRSITCGPENRFAVALTGTNEQIRIVGLAKLVEVQTGQGAVIGYVYDVAVAESYRRQGVAKTLLKSIIVHAKTENIDHLEVICCPQNGAACALLLTTGFACIAKTRQKTGVNLYRHLLGNK